MIAFSLESFIFACTLYTYKNVVTTCVYPTAGLPETFLRLFYVSEQRSGLRVRTNINYSLTCRTSYRICVCVSENLLLESCHLEAV